MNSSWRREFLKDDLYFLCVFGGKNDLYFLCVFGGAVHDQMMP
jgi:hypothetical protein